MFIARVGLFPVLSPFYGRPETFRSCGAWVSFFARVYETFRRYAAKLKVTPLSETWTIWQA
jgi:hypothetical protein